MRKDFYTKTIALNGKRIKVIIPRKLTEDERERNWKRMEELFKELVSAG